MHLGKAIALCAVALAVGMLIGIYVHSQLLSGAMEKLQKDAIQSVETVYK